MDFKAQRMIRTIVAFIFVVALIIVTSMKGFVPDESYNTAVFILVVSGAGLAWIVGKAVYNSYKNKKYTDMIDSYTDVEMKNAAFTAMQSRNDFLSEVEMESAASRKKREVLEKEYVRKMHERETIQRLIDAKNKAAEKTENTPPTGGEGNN